MNKLRKFKARKLDTINIVISILVAFAAWYYVAVDISPNITKTIRNIPISYEGEHELGVKGLGVESANADTVSVTVSLSRQDLGMLSTDSVKAQVNVANANKGTNSLPIKITASDGIKLKSQSSGTLTVEVASSSSKDVDVTACFSDVSETGLEPFASELSASRVSVLGAQSQVEKVEYVILPINSNAIQGTAKETLTVEPVAVDRNGEAVEHVVVLPSTISATVYRASTKSVALNVTVADSNASDGKTYEVPKTIVIKGKRSVIDEIEAIDADVVDISDVNSDANIKIRYNLPEGVQIASSSMASAVKVRFK